MERTKYIHDKLIKSTLTTEPTREDWDSYNLTGYKGFHEQGYKGERVKVAVIDTGILAIHDMFDDNVVEVRSTTYYGEGLDDQGHGTHVCGTIARLAPKCTILSYKALDYFGGGTSTKQVVKSITDAIRDAVARDADIISMSLGIKESELVRYGLLDDLKEAIQEAKDAEVFVCVSAGNDGVDPTEYYPSAFEGVTSVGALDEWFSPAMFSSVTQHIDMCQVGVDVMSASHANPHCYLKMSGTSMAQPVVAGIIALLMDKYKAVVGGEIDCKEFYNNLLLRCVDLHEEGFDNKTGVGFLTLKENIKTIYYPYGKDVMIVNGVEKKIPLGMQNMNFGTEEEPLWKSVLAVREDNEEQGNSVTWQPVGVTIRC